MIVAVVFSIIALLLTMTYIHNVVLLCNKPKAKNGNLFFFFFFFFRSKSETHFQLKLDITD